MNNILYIFLYLQFWIDKVKLHVTMQKNESVHILANAMCWIPYLLKNLPRKVLTSASRSSSELPEASPSQLLTFPSCIFRELP